VLTALFSFFCQETRCFLIPSNFKLYGFLRGFLMALFSSRVEAGKQLAAALKGKIVGDAVVLAIPRGGVVVGFEIAQALGVALDIIVPRKIGAPNNPELAIGAMTEDGTVILDQHLADYLGVSNSYVQQEAERQKMEIQRRLQQYRGNTPKRDLKGCVVILVDDGIATGSTMMAALASVRRSGAKKVIVAVPVGPPETILQLKNKADLVVCLYMPEMFSAIGEFYEDFSQTTDEEVRELLMKNREKTVKKET
jgi:putative phosphoribosyl transferase